MQNKYFILCLLLAASIAKVSAQNLVPNPSFEDTLKCPTDQDQLYNAPPWFKPTSNTSDYFNSCYTGSAIFEPDIPNNFWGYQFARTGNGYAGFATMCCTFGANNREYIEVKLLDSLIAGKKYCIEFFVSLSDSSTLAITNIGAYLSKDSVYVSGLYLSNLPYNPQIENTSNPIKDSVTWIKISGEYVAGGGNFYNDRKFQR